MGYFSRQNSGFSSVCQTLGFKNRREFRWGLAWEKFSWRLQTLLRDSLSIQGWYIPSGLSWRNFLAVNLKSVQLMPRLQFLIDLCVNTLSYDICLSKTFLSNTYLEIHVSKTFLLEICVSSWDLYVISLPETCRKWHNLDPRHQTRCSCSRGK